MKLKEASEWDKCGLFCQQSLNSLVGPTANQSVYASDDG